LVREELPEGALMGERLMRKVQGWRNQLRAKIEGGASWDAWTYVPAKHHLVFDRTVSGHLEGEEYYIEMTSVQTDADILRWLRHLNKKDWCPKAEIANLLHALDDLLTWWNLPARAPRPH